MDATPKKKKTQPSTLNMESLGDLSKLLDGPVSFGLPQEILLDLIDEDPNQPRKEDNPGFSDKALNELATTIHERGVKSPISLRENQDKPGRFIINHGARRFRAALLINKKTIPAFIDNDHNESDQIIENLQRNELTSREIADFIGRQLAKGKKKGKIAEEIGKSPAFVTQHVTLLDLPEPIANIFTIGRTKDVTVINELTTIFKKEPEETTAWLANENQEITRGTVKLFRDFLKHKNNYTPGEDNSETEQEIKEPELPNLEDKNNYVSVERNNEKEQEIKDTDTKASNQSNPGKLKKAIVQVEHDGRLARIILNRRPTAEGYAWLKHEDDGQEIEANLAKVQLLALMEG